MVAEQERLAESDSGKANWKEWGPYVSDRGWGTVREDYSADGSNWTYFPHDHARSRTYRWNEDGIGGFCNQYQNLCMAVALWNEKDPILKERLFGLSGKEGNHGEDVKEYYYYLDGTPTHSYMKMLYKYPQVEFPYALLVEENGRRGYHEQEYELIDALGDCFEQDRYFDVFVEYAKVDEEDILCRLTAINRGPDAAPLHLLPHLWFRNTWSWGHNPERPELRAQEGGAVRVWHRHLGERWWYVSAAGDEEPRFLFTNNDTNNQRLFNAPNESDYVKDGINRAVVDGEYDAVDPARMGTKAAAHIRATVAPGETLTVYTRFSPHPQDDPFHGCEESFARRIDEASDFYAALQHSELDDDERLVQRQAFAGLLWTKQFYHYSAELWLKGDPAMPPPPPPDGRRNHDWEHLYGLDVLSMPDKWEFPWFAAWDLAFHMIPAAMLDPAWAKHQMLLLLRERYMHPNGQIPAYEFDFGDVNPPVHAWGAWRVYQITRDVTGEADTEFLERAFHKLLLCFTWWVNQKDLGGNNIFQGGFLGLDNIGVFDRSSEVPTGGHLEQADGTAWMAMYCLNMLAMSLELAKTNAAYEDVAIKFLEHFIYIADAIAHLSGSDLNLWDPEDGFFYDMLHTPDGNVTPLKVRSLVGLIPLFAVETFEVELLERLPRFKQHVEWFLEYRPHLVDQIASLVEPGQNDRRLLAIADKEKLTQILSRMLDPQEFLSPYGLRSLSRWHAENPFTFEADGHTYEVRYEPAESQDNLFGGNSNWRGPIWFPINFLMIETLQKYHHYYGDDCLIESPAASGQKVTLEAVADDLTQRLASIFLRDENGRRPVFGGVDTFQHDPHWRDHILFYEYFHGDNGAGLGASHQTGWTALVAILLQEKYEKRRLRADLIRQQGS
jgi:hypothetical protein